jgi:hypothetical protein
MYKHKPNSNFGFVYFLCVLECTFEFFSLVHLKDNVVLKGRFLAKSAQIKNTRFESECINTNQIQIWASCIFPCVSECTFEGQCCFERPFFGQVGANQKHKV